MNKLIFVILIISALGFTRKSAEIRKIYADEKASSITYFMSHPLHDWDATAKTFKTVITYDDATNEIKSVAAVAKVQSFDSGNSNRDSHAIEVLDALKYPNISFTANDIVQNDNELAINGKLTFHGVTKPMTLRATRKDAASLMTITGQMNVNMTTHGVKPPGLMGMNTKENIRIDFTMAFKL